MQSDDDDNLIPSQIDISDIRAIINPGYIGRRYISIARDIIDISNTVFSAKYFADENWNETDFYDGLSDISRIEWRWEFLRRNELYRRFYLIHESEELGSLFFDRVDDDFRLDDFLATAFHLENIPDPRQGLNAIRHAASEWKFSIDNMFKPFFEGEVKFIESRREKRIRYHGEDITTLLSQSPFVFYAALDPRSDTEEQLDYLRYFLNKRKKFYFKRIHEAKFPAYIRALDAMDAGIAKTEFAKTSKNKAKNYHSGRDTYATAQRLRTDFISIS